MLVSSKFRRTGGVCAGIACIRNRNHCHTARALTEMRTKKGPYVGPRLWGLCIGWTQNGVHNTAPLFSRGLLPTPQKGNFEPVFHSAPEPSGSPAAGIPARSASLSATASVAETSASTLRQPGQSGASCCLMPAHHTSAAFDGTHANRCDGATPCSECWCSTHSNTLASSRRGLAAAISLTEGFGYTQSNQLAKTSTSRLRTYVSIASATSASVSVKVDGSVCCKYWT